MYPPRSDWKEGRLVRKEERYEERYLEWNAIMACEGVDDELADAVASAGIGEIAEADDEELVEAR
jgi:hypothetical protein